MLRLIEAVIVHPDWQAAARGNADQPLTEPGHGPDPLCEPVQEERRGLAGFHAEGKNGPHLHRRRAGVRCQ